LNVLRYEVTADGHAAEIPALRARLPLPEDVRAHGDGLDGNLLVRPETVSIHGKAETGTPLFGPCKILERFFIGPRIEYLIVLPHGKEHLKVDSIGENIDGDDCFISIDLQKAVWR